MESALTSMMSSSMAACKPYGSSHQATKTRSFPQPPAPAQPPLLPLPAQAPSPQQSSFWPAGRPAPRAKKPRRNAAPGPASAPIAVAAAPSRKRVAPVDEGEAVEWTETGSLHSVSPPPSSVPMPTSSLLATVAAGRKVGGAGVDFGATNELRRLLRL